MHEVTTIGLDIAKSVFQVHGIDATGKVVIRRQLKRRYVLAFFEKLAPCLVGIEACASSHHWSRALQALGHTVRLMPPAYVKPYVKRQKNDAADAEAICEAVTRANMRFVATKTPEQLRPNHRRWSGRRRLAREVAPSRGLSASQGMHVGGCQRLAADSPVAAVHLLDHAPGDPAHALAFDRDHRVGQLADDLALLFLAEYVLDDTNLDKRHVIVFLLVWTVPVRSAAAVSRLTLAGILANTPPDGNRQF